MIPPLLKRLISKPRRGQQQRPRLSRALRWKAFDRVVAVLTLLWLGAYTECTRRQAARARDANEISRSAVAAAREANRISTRNSEASDKAMSELLKLTGRSADAAEKAASAADGALQATLESNRLTGRQVAIGASGLSLNREALELGHRAWLWHKQTIPDRFDIKTVTLPWTIQFEVINGGNGPARNISICASVLANPLEPTLITEFPNIPDDCYINSGNLLPGQSLFRNFPMEDTPEHRQTLAWAQERKTWLFVLGACRYEDQFGRRHFSRWIEYYSLAQGAFAYMRRFQVLD